jgi:threonine dehydrogenase-like Zn-dependent dehydrogenase
LAEQAGAETLNYEDTNDLVEALKDLTAGRGPERCIDAVGMEAHGTSLYGKLERVKQAAVLQLDNATVLRQAFQACGKGGTVSIPGVYGGYIDKFPFGTVWGKGLTIRTGQCNTQKYMKPLLERIQRGDIRLPEIITHRARLEDAAEMYRLFEGSKDECIKVVMQP